ncbi:molybdopterin molybdotransferase MoeA [Parapedobacter sp. 2B3]|uniref:molybdopterin molybdotransferase MoeA n=1 Tax=Parapedobacter sp. 2B3 TaxID=3342381 RepID=UPI0035B675D0
MEFITVENAEEIIQSQTRDYGTVSVPYTDSLGRVLAENLFTDRDLPPFNRATVDGIAMAYHAYAEGQRTFKISAVQAAGETPAAIRSASECIEIMTGAALDHSVDTVVRYEDIAVAGGAATVKGIEIKQRQNVHFRGKDKKEGDAVADAGWFITPALIGLAASIGKTALMVKQLPKVVIITTGDELVNVEENPTPYQLRRSNDVTIQSVLAHYGIRADKLHVNDDYDTIKDTLQHCLQSYDVLLLTGGVSMGKFDHIPQAMEHLGVKKLFHKVRQRPGKPFWFGTYCNQQLVFAFPGNPVSVFMCLHRYFIPWLERSLGIETSSPQHAVLQHDMDFPYPLQYFAQVKLAINHQGVLTARAVETNGSGDFSNLIHTDAFMELPLERNTFKKGEVYKVWPYNV